MGGTSPTPPKWELLTEKFDFSDFSLKPQTFHPRIGTSNLELSFFIFESKTDPPSPEIGTSHGEL